MDYSFVDDFTFVSDALKISGASLCERIGISRSFVMSVLNGTHPVSPRLLEAFYSFAYQAGLRINKGTEEILLELHDQNLCFHGSRNGLGQILPDGSRKDCDFGAGFYLGTNYLQAASFVFGSKTGSVYAFSFDKTGLKGSVFHCDLEWMLLVCYYRGKLNDYKEHPLLKQIVQKSEGVDYIIAPIADNKMFQVMRQFGDGEINSEEALHALSASSLGEQVVLKTSQAISHLQMLSHLYLCEEEKKSLRLHGEERSKEVETKLKLAKREFRSSGKYIDEVLL